MGQSLITTSDVSNKEIEALFQDARSFLDGKFHKHLENRVIMTLFFENSTRTRSSFELAAKKLGATVVHLNVENSSTKKGETLLDTAANLDAMGPDAIILRHKDDGIPKMIDEHIQAHVINAGDGRHAHPSQALLDLFTITEHFKGAIEGKHIAIVGDIKNSRVANSNIKLLTRMGLNITLVAPEHFQIESEHPVTDNLAGIIDNVDIIMSLRTQTERHDNQTISMSQEEYAKRYCITSELLQDRDILIMHPGPVHRNIDISDDVLADKRCKVLEQVRNGVAIRMSILKHAILS